MKYINILKENKLLVLILIIASALRLYRLDFQSIWLDEIYTMKITNPSWSLSELILEVDKKEGFPYIYFITLNIMHSVFGYTPIVARSFSAIFGILSVLMIYKFGKLLFNKNVGLVVAILTTFSEFCIFTSQDARPYSFYFFSIILSFYFLVKFLRFVNLRNALFYGLSCAVLLNSNFFSLVNIFSQYLILLLFLFLQEKPERKIFFKYSLYSGILAFLLYIPNYRLIKKVLEFKSGWIPAPTSDSLTLIFKELIGGSEATIFIIMPIFFYYLIDLFKSKDTEIKYEQIIENKKVFGFLILGIWTLVLVGVNYLKSHADTSIMISRYFVSVLPVFLLVTAIGINLINNKIVKIFVLTSLCFFMFSNLVFAKKYYKDPIKTQFREASNFVKENNNSGENVYTSLKYFFDYFLESETKFKLEEKPSLESLLNEMQSDTTKIKSFWYVDAHNNPFKLSEGATAFSEKVFFVDKSFEGLDSWSKHYVIKSDKLDVIDFPESNKGDKIKGWIEEFGYNGNEINMKGWAFIEGIDANDSQIEIVLIKDKKAIVIPSTTYSRNDITKAEKQGFNLDNSGFSLKSDLKNIPKGSYSIAIKIENLKNKKKGVFNSDKKIDIIK